MSIEIKLNTARIIDLYNKKDKQIVAALRSGLKDGMHTMQRQFVKQQLSGRPGLNRVSGTAANSLLVDNGKETKDGGYIVNMYVAKRAWYMKVHQHYKFDGWIKYKSGKKVYIPKRLTLLEDFQSQGPQVLYAAMYKKGVKALQG